MTTALHRKLGRDLRRLRAQVVSIALVVGCGIMAAVAMRSTRAAIDEARDGYYARQRFADVFAAVRRAPEPVAARLAALPGVGAVATRVTLRVTLDVPRLPDPASAIVVSIPDDDRPTLGALLVQHGRLPRPGADDEVVASARFADENALRPGATLGAVLEGRWRRLRVVGVGSSPEYVFETGAAGFAVDNRRFGVLWMRRAPLAAAAGMRGAFDDVALRLAPGADADAVVAGVDGVLAPYGAPGAVTRAHQPSHQVIADELHQLDAMARVFPVFFIAVAAFLLNVVLSRLVATQRDEIAALKAFGYTDREVALHYLGFAAVAVALGAVLGVLGGRWLGGEYTRQYAEVFRFPQLRPQVDWATAAVATAITGGAALAGALGAVWGAVRVPPAEALRPPAPARYRPLLLEWLGLGDRLPTAARMVLRVLERRPWRTLAAVLGVGLAGALVVGGLSPWGAVRRMVDVQWGRVERADLTVTFVQAREGRALAELAAVPGVLRVEGFRATAVRLSHAAGDGVRRERRTALMGLDGDAALRQLVDVRGERHRLPAGGLVLPAGLADALAAGPGDTLDVALTERGAVTRRLVVGAVLPEMLGFTAYLDRRALAALLDEGDVVSGAWLRTEGDGSAVAARFKRVPGVAGVVSRAALLDTFRRTTEQSLATSVGVILLSACVIAAGVLYNQARVALGERARELASLRVLGFTRQEVRRMLLGEQAAVTLLGLPLGALLGTAFGMLLMDLFAAERHRFPLALGAGSYLVGAAVIVGAAVLAAVPIARRADRLDLVAVLKTRE